MGHLGEKDVERQRLLSPRVQGKAIEAEVFSRDQTWSRGAASGASTASSPGASLLPANLRRTGVAEDFAPGVHDADAGFSGDGEGVGDGFAIGDGDEPPAGGTAELLDGVQERGRRFDFNDQIANVYIEAIGVFDADAVSLDEPTHDRRMCLVGHNPLPNERKMMVRKGGRRR